MIAQRRRATDREVRSFGFFMFAVGALAAYHARRRGWSPLLGPAAFAVGLALALGGVFAPAVVRPARDAWMGLGRVMGRVTSPVVLSGLFFCVFVPIGVLLRALRIDVLDARWRPEAPTYWKSRARPGFCRDDFEHLG